MTFGCLEALAVVYTPLLLEKVVGRAGYFSNQLVQLMHYMKPEDYGPYYEAVPVQDVLEIVLPKETVAVVGLAILVVTTIWCVLTTTTEVATPTDVVEGYPLDTIPEEVSEWGTWAAWDAMVDWGDEVVEETSTLPTIFLILHNNIYMVRTIAAHGFEIFKHDGSGYDFFSGEYFDANNGMWCTGTDLFMQIQTIKDIATGIHFFITKENLRGWSVVVPDQSSVSPHPYLSPNDSYFRMHFNEMTVHGLEIAEQPEPKRIFTLV
jgi:hypothetical protein